MTNPIKAAIEPTREAAHAEAMAFGERVVASYLTRLDASGWNLDVAFPYPHGSMSRASYVKAKNSRAMAEMLTTRVKDDGYKYRIGRAPNMRVASPEGAARFMEIVAAEATAQFDSYVAKLCVKVGDCTAATVHGVDHLWSYSTLVVTKADGSTERWNTRRIVNVSALGKVFNQWPTRKAK